jgi:hypothetical protein
MKSRQKTSISKKSLEIEKNTIIWIIYQKNIFLYENNQNKNKCIKKSEREREELTCK